jgi:hypothetical protein
MAHAWASSTLQGTARQLGGLSNFGQKYGINLLPAAPITQLPLMSFICASVINHDITKVMGH